MHRPALAIVVLAAALAAVAAETPPPPTAPAPADTRGVNIQRSMNLMAGSTGLKRNTVRVLFYGQSITAADWTKIVAERLRRKYPLTDFVIENRAIPAYDSERLVRTSEADLYPFYPDLVIFHAYGGAGAIDDIIRRIRERTTADVLIATDHVAPLIGEKMDEITDPLKLSPPKPGDHDASWRSHVFLPALAKKYGAEIADVRLMWKQNLRDKKLSPSDLLYDDLHLNDRGNVLMADIILSHLKHRPDLAPHFEDRRVKTYVIGEDVHWKDGKLVLPFDGNKVDLICREGAGPGDKPAAIRIEGKRPSEHPELYGFSRTTLDEPFALLHPPVLRIQAQAPLLVEDWALTVVAIDRKAGSFRFRLIGSRTGEDGDGESGKRFVSNSKRIVLEPEDFSRFFYSLECSRDRDAKSAIIRWKTLPWFADEFAVPAKRNPFGETTVIAAQGLSNGRHVIEIAGGPETPLAAIRVYRPSR